MGLVSNFRLNFRSFPGLHLGRTGLALPWSTEHGEDGVGFSFLEIIFFLVRGLSKDFAMLLTIDISSLTSLFLAGDFCGRFTSPTLGSNDFDNDGALVWFICLLLGTTVSFSKAYTPAPLILLRTFSIYLYILR